MIERLALQDGDVDTEERAVLSRVFARVRSDNLDPAVRAEIERFKERFQIP